MWFVCELVAQRNIHLHCSGIWNLQRSVDWNSTPRKWGRGSATLHEPLHLSSAAVAAMVSDPLPQHRSKVPNITSLRMKGGTCCSSFPYLWEIPSVHLGLEPEMVSTEALFFFTFLTILPIPLQLLHRLNGKVSITPMLIFTYDSSSTGNIF